MSFYSFSDFLVFWHLSEFYVQIFSFPSLIDLVQLLQNIFTVMGGKQLRI
jgi:hypothetical protein